MPSSAGASRAGQIFIEPREREPAALATNSSVWLTSGVNSRSRRRVDSLWLAPSLFWTAPAAGAPFCAARSRPQAPPSARVPNLADPRAGMKSPGAAPAATALFPRPAGSFCSRGCLCAALRAEMKMRGCGGGPLTLRTTEWRRFRDLGLEVPARVALSKTSLKNVEMLKKWLK